MHLLVESPSQDWLHHCVQEPQGTTEDRKLILTVLVISRVPVKINCLLNIFSQYPDQKNKTKQETGCQDDQEASRVSSWAGRQWSAFSNDWQSVATKLILWDSPRLSHSGSSLYSTVYIFWCIYLPPSTNSNLHSFCIPMWNGTSYQLVTMTVLIALDCPL